MEKISFKDDGVHFINYAIISSSVFPNGSILWNEILEADPDTYPPELRLRSGEVLFISASLKEAFAVACIRHQIPIVQRTDLWALLLEPYLDTEVTELDKRRNHEALIHCGFSTKEIKSIRSRVANKILFYNAFTWEWIHLGLFDLLAAHGLVTNVRFSKLKSFWRSRSKNNFYHWSLKIANRKKPLTS